MVAGDRMRLLGLLLVAMVFGMTTAKAGNMPPPFELPDGYSQRPIPQGLGMRFFQGKWDYIGRGGMLPTTVTNKAFIYEASGGIRPYRVLVETRNYVLLASLLTPNMRTTPNIPWTNFVVLTLAHGKGEDPYSVYANMIYHSCGHESMDGGDHAFSWSKEKLMRVFRASCLAGIDPKDKFPFGAGWSGSRYQRR